MLRQVLNAFGKCTVFLSSFMLDYSTQPSFFLCTLGWGSYPFFSVTYCLWKSLMSTVGLPPIPNHPLSITTLQGLHVQSTGYSKLLWDNIGKVVVTSLVPWATLTFKRVVKPGTVSFIRINTGDWVRQAVGWPQQGSQGTASLTGKTQAGEWHGLCPYAASLHEGCSHEGMAGTQLCQAALLSKSRMDVHKELHPWVNNRGSG